MSQNQQREQLGSRIGFLLLAAGCAIGLGNVWRFPYIAGAYGGALFVFIYIGFLLAVGVPILVMEFSVGRAAQRNLGAALQKLEPKGSRWHTFGPLSLIGSYLLMMFYTTVAGWMLAYCWSMLKGDLSGLTPEQVGGFFGGLISDPTSSCLWMGVAVIFCFTVCGMGLRRGVERVVKFMMVGLFALMIALVVRAVTLPGGEAGISFYLMPDPEKLTGGLWAAVTAAMGQAFFTLSLGIGAIAVFGSYIGRQYALAGEALRIGILDTFVALMSGMIIFPACFSFGLEPGQGPSLIFMTLPRVFVSMTGGRLWGALFFLFLTFASFTTVLAVFENIMASCMDNFGWSRKKATIVCGIFILLASMPCVLGYNLWYFEASLPSGATGQILDIEDFLVSNLLLPIGSLIYLLFCVSKWGWGFDKYLAEANKGTGLGMSPRFKIYFQFILPMLILVILLVGLGSWGWRALICAAVAVFVWFMARRSSSKSTI